MKIIATSDLHGNLPTITEPFDLFLIGGDVCPAECHYYDYQATWFEIEFINWINGLPFKDENSRVILVWGNHDFVGERSTHSWRKKMEALTGGQLKILNHSSYDFEYPVSDGVDALRIFGTPYCSIFGRWAFMLDDDALEKKFSQIPEDVDILLSHDSPYLNDLGAITQGKYKTNETGNKILTKHIERVKPKIFLSGHFHSGNHNFEEVNGTYMANISYVDEAYEPANPFLSIDYDEEHRKINGYNFIYYE